MLITCGTVIYICLQVSLCRCYNFRLYPIPSTLFRNSTWKSASFEDGDLWAQDATTSNKL